MPRDWLGERLQNDVFCVECDIKPQLSQFSFNWSFFQELFQVGPGTSWKENLLQVVGGGLSRGMSLSSSIEQCQRMDWNWEHWC